MCLAIKHTALGMSCSATATTVFIYFISLNYRTVGSLPPHTIAQFMNRKRVKQVKKVASKQNQNAYEEGIYWAAAFLCQFVFEESIADDLLQHANLKASECPDEINREWLEPAIKIEKERESHDMTLQEAR